MAFLPPNQQRQSTEGKLYYSNDAFYTQGDGDVISMPADFRRHVVGKTPITVFTVISLKCASLAR